MSEQWMTDKVELKREESDDEKEEPKLEIEKKNK
jgi:hypothetical protein